MNTCPTCKLKLTSSESRSGKCPSCKAPLAESNGGMPAAGQRRETNRQPKPASRNGVCQITGEQCADLRKTFLRVAKVAVGLSGSVRVQYVNVEINSSGEAYRRGRNIMWMSMLIGMSWLILAIGGMALLCLLEAAGASQAVMKTLSVPVFLGIPVAMIAGFIAMPIYRRRKLNSLLPKELNNSLKQLSGCKDWGFRYNVVFLGKIPRNEASIPYSILSSINNAGGAVAAMI